MVTLCFSFSMALSMDANQEFEIAVHILNVVGYEFQNDRILLRAVLDGNQLQTDEIIARTDKVQVLTQIKWTTTKKEIKRMKAENIPLKINCFRIRDLRLESIGYRLIPIRIIPTFLTKNNLLSSPRWYKLAGIPNNVAHNRPELLLNVIIQPEQESPSTYENAFDDESLLEPDFSNHFELNMDLSGVKEVIEGDYDNHDSEEQPAVTAKAVESSKKSPVLVNEEELKDNYVNKLEQWKLEEKENFLSNLKKMENSFLESMFEEWQRKRQDEEQKLKWSIEECARLSKKLEDGFEQLKASARNEVASSSGKEATNDRVRKETERLEVELKEERMENKELRGKIKQLESQIGEAKDTRTKLLEENKQLVFALSKMKQSKDYYKQKWVQLIREVNKLDQYEI